MRTTDNLFLFLLAAYVVIGLVTWIRTRDSIIEILLESVGIAIYGVVGAFYLLAGAGLWLIDLGSTCVAFFRKGEKA